MKNIKQQYIGVAIILIVILNIFLIYNTRENLKNINSDIENNDMAILVNGEAQSTIPVKGSGNYDVTVNCTNGTASWDYDNWGITINTIDKGNIKCNVEFKTTYLRTASNVVATGVFLNGPLVKNTIESIEFMTSNNVPNEALGSWDVSANQDKSIMAWYYDRDSNGLYEVYIGGNGGVFANSDSSYLFQNLTYLSSINLANLDTSNVTNMSYMFWNTGYSSTIFTLDLGDKFNTVNVTNMSYMFRLTGYNSTVFTLNLGDKFNTVNVTNMSYMFYQTGYSSTAFTLNLGDKFNTANVTDMGGMFGSAGYSSTVFTLNLGDKFDTSKVTEMSSMFYATGYSSTVFTLNLGDKFDTSKVTTMYGMFYATGYSSTVFTLNLGDKFDTSKVTEMSYMFYLTGYKSTVFTLNLGSKFDTSKVILMQSMFSDTGYSSTVFTLDLGDKFDTSNVTNMSNMFRDTGYSSPVFTLNFGNKFDTSKVANMGSMFAYIGYSNSYFTLDLRTFNFDKVTNYSNIFYASKATHTAYVKNASDKTWVTGKGFAGTIIDCSSNTCP